MTNWSSGSYLVLKCTTPRKKIDLYAIGYKYSKSEAMIFIATKGAGLTSEGAPYFAKYTDLHQNRVERKNFRPSLLAEYFEDANKVDTHNHARQGELRLEKCWLTQDCWFRIATTFIGMTVTDAWKAFKYHLGQDNISIRTFADRLAKELIYNPYSNEEKDRFIPPISSIQTNVVSPTSGVHENMSPISMCSEIGALHSFETTKQVEGKERRTKRRVCGANDCTERTSLECTNPTCRDFTILKNRFKSKGVFFCEKHIHLHYLTFMPRKNTNDVVAIN